MAENRQIGSVFAHLWNSRSKLGKKNKCVAIFIFFGFFIIIPFLFF